MRADRVAVEHIGGRVRAYRSRIETCGLHVSIRERYARKAGRMPQA